MKAAFINKTGPPEVIIYGDLPTPKPSRSECLIKVAAVDMNPIDIYILAGMIPAAQVIGPARSAQKVALCQKRGADLALSYKADAVDARIKEFAANGVNVWWETVREPNFERTIALLAMRGRMILMAGRDAKPV